MKNLFTVLFLILLFCLPVLNLSANDFGMQNENKSGKTVKDKRVDLLEKLEKGSKISSGEIAGTLGKAGSDDDRNMIVNNNRSSEFIIIPPIPPVVIIPHHHYGGNHDHALISEEDIREIHRAVNQGLEDLRDQIIEFRRSDEYKDLQKELQRWNEGFKRDMEKMKEELKREREAARSRDRERVRM
jgi:hypothetical protein